MINDFIDPTQAALMAAGLSVIAYLPYAKAVLDDNARPQRSSWFIWALLSIVAVTSVRGSGGTQGLIFTTAQMAGTTGIFVMSLWRGTGSFVGRSELTVLGGSAAGLALWAWTSDPRWAMGLSIAVGALAGTLTISKAYRQPHTEALLPWTLQWMAAVFGVLSVLGGTAMEMAYPVYLLALYSGITGADVMGRMGVPLHMRRPRIRLRRRDARGSRGAPSAAAPRESGTSRAAA